MSKIRKIISMLLAVSMIMALASCGKSPGTNPGNSGSNAANPGTEPVKLTIGIQSRPNVETYDENALTLYLEELLNVDLEFEFFSSDADEMKTQLSALVAANQRLPDVLFGIALSAEERTMYGNDGYLMDLAPYFDDPEWPVTKEINWKETFIERAGENTYTRAMYENRTSSGAMYCWPSSCASITDQPRNQVYINQTWLDKLNLKMPTTYDELVEVLRAFKTGDPNGNGVIDEIPMVGASGIARSDIPSWIISNWIYLNDEHVFNITDDGKIYVPYTEDAYREGVRAVRDLVKEDLLNTLTWTIAESSELPALYTPADEVAKIGVWAGHMALRVTQDNPVMFEYEALKPFHYAPIEPLSIATNFYITTDCENFEAAARFLMAFSDLDVYRVARYGVEGTDWVEITDYSSQKPMVKILNNDAYAGQTSSTWGIMIPGLGWMGGGSPWSNGSDTPSDEDDWGTERGDKLLECAELTLEAAAANNPKNVFTSVVYSEEELEGNGTSLTDIMDYVKQARAEFAIGVLDIDSDTDWNNYLKTIQSLGLDTLLQNTQAAYDRLEQ